MHPCVHASSCSNKRELSGKSRLISRRWRSIVHENRRARVGAPKKCIAGKGATLSASLLYKRVLTVSVGPGTMHTHGCRISRRFSAYRY